MELRNGKIVMDIEKVFFEKLDKFKKFMAIKKFYLFIDFLYQVPEFFHILNRYMDDIVFTYYIKNKKHENFKTFLENIPQLEKIAKTLRNYNEGRYAFLRDNIEKSAVYFLKKMDKFKKLYKKEINEVLCRLTCKIGMYIAKEIETYI